MNLLHPQSSCVHVVLQDELLQVEERLLVRGLGGREGGRERGGRERGREGGRGKKEERGSEK